MHGQYRISFYRTLLNEVGRQRRCRLAAIDIRSARSIERAIEAGKHRFARSRNIPAWDHLAEDFEVEAIAQPVEAQRPGAALTLSAHHGKPTG